MMSFTMLLYKIRVAVKPTRFHKHGILFILLLYIDFCVTISTSSFTRTYLRSSCFCYDLLSLVSSCANCIFSALKASSRASNPTWLLQIKLTLKRNVVLRDRRLTLAACSCAPVLYRIARGPLALSLSNCVSAVPTFPRPNGFLWFDRLTGFTTKII